MREMGRLPGIALALFAALWLSPLAASGQETTGALAGRIVDSQGLSVPGASVTATGPQGAKTAVSGDDGRFSVPFLTPGVYTVTVELQGFKISQQSVNVRVGQTADIPVTLEVGGLSESINVLGTPRIVDTTTTTTGATLAADELVNIPVGRRFADTMYLAPGVSSSGSLGRMNPSISGSSGLENQYVVDGTNVTNAGYGGLGSYSIIFGSLGNSTPYDFIKEIEVKTGGYDAEFGQATGGVVNVVTKSGSNQFDGSVFAYSQPTALQGTYRQFQATNGSVSTIHTDASDGGAEGGGPIVKNKVFFFGAIDPSRQATQFQAPPGFPLASLGTVDRVRQTTSYAAKGTVQMSAAHRIDVSFFGDPSHGPVGPQRTSALLVDDTSSYSTLDYGGHEQTVKYSGVLTSHFLLEATFARANNKISELPSVDQWRITDQTVTPTVITGGIGRYEAGNQSLNRSMKVKATNIFNGHELKYGVDYSNVPYNQFNDITGPAIVGPDGRTTATGVTVTVLPDINYGSIYRVTRANYNNGHDTIQRYTDFFVQDSWKIGTQFTINPGVRYDQESLDGDLIKGWTLKNNWAPRLGFTYDPTADGRTKISGNYGIYFARVPNDLAARALSADDGYSRIDYFDAALSTLVPTGTVTQTPTGAPTTTHSILLGAFPDNIDPNTRLSYQNEVVLGVEREIATDASFGVRYVFRNMPRVLEDISDCPMGAYEDPLTSGISCGSVYLLSNPGASTAVNPQAIALVPAFAQVKFDDPIHKYHAVEVSLNRHGSNWSAMTSYRWSRLRGNFEGFYRDDNGQSDPGISSLYDFPTNDPTYSTYFPAEGSIQYLGQSGVLPLDRPEQVKVAGNYTFGMGLNIGANLNLTSGKPLTPLAANPVYDSPGEITTEPRGSGIQTIDGFLTRTPFESQLDLQASWGMKVGARSKLTLVADIFNALNERRVTGYDQNSELTAGTPNPDFGKPVSILLAGNPAQYQVPITMRIGARLTF